METPQAYSITKQGNKKLNNSTCEMYVCFLHQQIALKRLYPFEFTVGR